MSEITDLTELCRLCLNTSPELISFETTSSKSNQNIPTLIKFCLDINCSAGEDNVLPKNVCGTCLEKLEVTFELKMNAQESDKYLKQILFNSGEDMDEHSIIPYDPAPYPHQGLDQSQSTQEDDLLQPFGDYFEPIDSMSFKEEGKFKCKLCSKTFKYGKSFRNHQKQHKSLANYAYDEPEEEASEQDQTLSADDSNYSEYSMEGQRTGDHVCSCGKTFKYKKPYKNHLKLDGHHNPTKMTNKIKLSSQKSSARSSGNQAPYDSRSPYESPAPFKSSSLRDSSPDLNLTMVNSSFLNNLDEHQEGRKRKQTFPSRSSSKEPSPELVDPKKRSRGRPRKHFAADSLIIGQNQLQRLPSLFETNKGSSENIPKRGRPRKSSEPVESKALHPDVGLGLFSEVDVSRMLKAKPIRLMDDESLTVPSENSDANRSRSPSVEVVQEFDIFGSAVTSNDVLSAAPKPAPGSRSLHVCDVWGCNKKFHLKANLKKHQREHHQSN